MPMNIFLDIQVFSGNSDFDYEFEKICPTENLTNAKKSNQFQKCTHVDCPKLTTADPNRSKERERRRAFCAKRRKHPNRIKK